MLRPPLPSGVAADAEDLALVDRIARGGRIVECDPAQAGWLGHAAADLVGADWSRIYTDAARAEMQALFDAPPAGPVARQLVLRDAGGHERPVCALIEVGHHGEGKGAADLSLRTFKWRGADFMRAAEMAEANAVLLDILNASDDPSWCIEYSEPVDLSAPEQEVIRQFFENRRRWRFCNSAMARFYRLPPGEDLNAHPVDEILGRSPENDQFARLLLRNNFDVVRALSRDTRYDGTTIDVENDVRGLIRDNHLHRIWGTVRDVSKHLRRSEQLRKRVGDLELALAAVPDALLLVDGQGVVDFANAAAEALVGRASDLIVGQGLEALIDTGGEPDWLASRIARDGAEALRRPLHVDLLSRDGPVRAELNARSFEAHGQRHIAVTLRKLSPRARPETARGAFIA